jgi:soluble lytic murein transglycosylase
MIAGASPAASAGATASAGVKRMATGIANFNAGRLPEAEADIKAAIESGLLVDDYAYFYLGLIQLRTKRFEVSRVSFERLLSSGKLSHKASVATQLEARFHVAESYLQESNWRQALSELEILRRKWRASELYSDVLWKILRSEVNSMSGKNKSASAGTNLCRTAREIYSKYPTLTEAHEWGADLALNTVDGIAIKCSASDADLKLRIRRLQWGGEAARAQAELPVLQKHLGGGYAGDSAMISFLISDGQTDEAMKILLKYYDSEKNHPNYLLLLAKAASRAGDNATAVGTYQQVYDRAPHSSIGTNALFQAAFTSYQMQDYDGAARRFEKFIHLSPGSKLTRDSRWHLAWIRYLRADYAGAYQSLAKIAALPIQKGASTFNRGRRGGRGRRILTPDSISVERVRYWSAMSLLRMGKSNEAVSMFQQLARDPSIGYYAIAAQYRLHSILGTKADSKIVGSSGATTGDENVAAEAAAVSEAEYAATEPGASDTTADTGDEAGPDSEGTNDVADTAEEVAKKIVNASATFARAHELLAVGLEEAARRELLDLERHVRGQDERKSLIGEFQQAREFYRSSYMGDVAFGSVRLKNGLRGEGRPFWEFAYPRAFDVTVSKMAKVTSVPEEFIWGIMRAESHYRTDARSAVGALGLMQIMPFTGRQLALLANSPTTTLTSTPVSPMPSASSVVSPVFEPNSLLVPENNISLGTRYLQRLLAKFQNNVPLAAASYNAGPHRVHAWVRNFGSLDMDEFIEHIPFVETRNYVKKVVRNYEIYGLLYGAGKHSSQWMAKPVGVQVDEKIPTREVW